MIYTEILDKGESMKLILDNLKQHTIISSQYIQTLQQSLKEEHPDLTTLQRAQLFSQALHQILDDALMPFDVNLQKLLKHTLLKQTLQKDDFSIDAFDIFNAYTHLEASETNSIAHLATWINHYQQHPLSLNDVHVLATSFKQQTNPQNLSAMPVAIDFIAGHSDATVQQSNFFSDTLTYLLHYFTDKRTCLLLILLFFLTIGFSSLYVTTRIYESRKASISRLSDTVITLPISLDIGTSANYMQRSLQYKDFNKKALQVWLEQRNSLLATEPYFSTIIETAKAFNISPLLLFSITGQEQNFVPKTHQHAAEIANNPFNLFGSWESYNTSIKESARIVSRTLINLGKDCPEDEDQIKWINKAYAADSNWHLGVTYFFNELQTATTLSGTSIN